MAYTQKNLDELDAIIASGAIEGSFDGKHAKYDSFEELVKRRAYVAAQISGSSRARYSLAAFTKDSSQPSRSTAPDPFGTNQT